MTSPPQLRILGAAYGLSDYTATLAEFVDARNELHLADPSSVLDDPWPGTVKSLVVVHQYGTAQPRTVVVKQDQPLSVVNSGGPPLPTPAAGSLQVLGAAYGLADVTAAVAGLVSGNSLQLTANDATLGTSSSDVATTLTVVYRYGSGSPRTKTWLKSQPVRIWPSASYALSVDADTTVLGSGVYAAGTTDLTLEAWVQTAGPGPLLSFAAPGTDWSLYESIAFGVSANGALGLRLWHAPSVTGGSRCTATSGPTELCDGNWHHVAAVRAGGDISLLVDGVPQQVSVTGSGPAGVDIGNDSWFSLGYQSFTLQGRWDFGAANLTGAVDEVRLWAAARTPAEIADGMHHYLADPTPGLVGHWTFDDQSLAGSTGAALTSDTPAAFIPSEVDLEPPGSPYLVTQAQLMDDFVPDASHPNGAPIDGYRVVIAARDGNGNPIGAEITVWAADPDYPAYLYTFDGKDWEITDQNRQTFTTNSYGEVNFVINANSPHAAMPGNPLLCPIVKVRADFMADDELVVIAADRHAHAVLANLTGDQLTGRAPLGSGKQAALTTGLSAADADAVAQAISHVMTAAVEHSVQPEHPLTRKRDTPIDTALPQPYTPMYENISTLVAPYDFASNAVSTHYLPTDQSVLRVLAAESMPTPYWQLSFGGTGGTAGFSQLSPDERTSTIQALAQVSPFDDLTRLVTGQASTLAQSSLLSVAGTEVTASTRPTSLWGSLSSASRLVFDTVEKEIAETGQRVKAVVVYVIDSAERAVSAVLLTVKDALDFVVALLKRFAVGVYDIVNFIKTAFDWDDIRATQQVVAATLSQLPGILKTAVTAMEDYVEDQLTKLQTAVDTEFDQWIQALTGRSANSESAAAKSQPPQPVQHKYLTSMFADNAGAIADQGNGGLLGGDVVSASALSTLEGKFPQDSLTAAQDALAQSGLGSYLVSMESLLDTALAKILGGLKTAISDVLDLVKDAVQAFFDMVEEVFDTLYAAATQPLVIPWFSTFYEQVVLGGTGESLTVLSLVAMAAAIPLTVTYRLASGQPGGPFSQADAAAVRSGTWADAASITAAVQQYFGGVAAQASTSNAVAADAAATPSLPDAKQKAFWALGFTYAASTVLWGVCCAVEDTLPTGQAAPKSLIVVKLAAQFLAVGSGLPVFSTTPGAGHNPTVPVLLWCIWSGGVIALLSNCAAAASSWFAAIIDPWLTGIYGALQMYGYVAISAVIGAAKHSTGGALFMAALGVGESFEWVPQLGKPVATREEEPVSREAILHVLIPRVELAAYMWVALLTTVSTGMQIEQAYQPAVAS